MRNNFYKCEVSQLNLQTKIEGKQSSNEIKQEFIALDYCSPDIFMQGLEM